MSPEIVSKKEYDGTAADVWACGILLYVLLNGTFPFKSPFEKDLYRKIKHGGFGFTNPLLSEDAKHLIKYMLKIDPSKRPTAS